MKHIPVRNEEIVWRNLDGEAVLLNPHTGKYFGMNAVGCSFWEKVDGNRSLSEISDLLFAEYDVEKTILEKDLEELTVKMVEKELISFSE